MAKKSVKNRNSRRQCLVMKYKARRDELRDLVRNIQVSEKERWDAMVALQNLPRDSSPVRVRKRCKYCGRPRGNDNLTGLCRLHMRMFVLAGNIPGVRKGSW